ncbi:MAG TPA: GC-type dockerin domain-anchored protein, partial [Phycisphaerales bacterium]|nr:GC-type dockerin domain-anchored protein [Phycisphaerales bacterium]
LGYPEGVPGPLGGICFKPGDNNKVLIGGAANSAGAMLYEIAITRSPNGFITGFSGTATPYAACPGIDGGLCVAPGSGGTLIYTTYPSNMIGQIQPGDAGPDRVDAMADFGISGTTGTCQFVPASHPGAGNLVIGSYSTGFYWVLPMTPVAGTSPTLYQPGQAGEHVSVGFGPEGIVYIPLFSPIFNETPTMLVSEYGAGAISAYDVGPDGRPVAATRRVFIGGLSGAEGAALDPRTNSLLFSTFGGGAGVVMVPGFNLPPCGPADIGRSGGLFGPDGLLNNNDFVVMIDRFFANDPRADYGGVGGVAGADGLFDNNDFVVFIDIFFAGCPEE